LVFYFFFFFKKKKKKKSSLADNQLTGEIPENIDELTYLTKFSFRNNNLSGKIPDSIGNIDGIFHLYVFTRKKKLVVMNKIEY